MELNKKQVEKLISLETSDYQNRRGEYPKANMPTSIEAWSHNGKAYINCSFKNTSESTAKRWLASKLRTLGIDVDADMIITEQEGDYHDDWVCSHTKFDIKAIEVVNSSELTTDVDLVCTHCGQDHNIRDSYGKLMTEEGKDYCFERKGTDEWCICIKCQKECNEKGLK